MSGSISLANAFTKTYQSYAGDHELAGARLKSWRGSIKIGLYSVQQRKGYHYDRVYKNTAPLWHKLRHGIDYYRNTNKRS